MRRSQLYVPGNVEKMITKSSTLKADSIILDLEDAVPRAQKESARNKVKKAASEVDWGRRELCVRTNPPATRLGRDDIALVGSVERVDTLVIPKAEGNLSSIHRSTGKHLIPIIETAKGLESIGEVAGSKGVDAISFGAADFALSVGGSVSQYLRNTYVKTRIVVTARSVGIDPIDNVFFDLGDPQGFKRMAKEAKALGFSGKQVIHPSQIDVVNRIFSPTSDELKWANKVLKAYKRSIRGGRGALSIEGSLVDEVHYKIAKRVLGNVSVQGHRT